jgi:hypothetical protein
MPLKTFLVSLVLLMPIRVLGDVAYGGYHEIAVSNFTSSFKHVHDWWKNEQKQFAMYQRRNAAFFSEENDFSYVEYIDVTGKLLFRSPSPALTKLWIEPRSQFVVGLSNIKLRNPYQLVVWRRDGTLIHRQKITRKVVEMNDDGREEFETLFPETAKKLADQYFTYEGKTYLTMSFPNFLEGDRKAVEYLRTREEPHPYGVSESVSNYVNWYPECVELNIENWRDKVPVLTMKKPDGKVISVELKGIKN